jgi:maltooligosyltrehalose trehalohydrolase
MLMAVADFPGNRKWGYDGVDLFAPSRAYGGPEALRRLVDAAHARGLGVILDVVFNHLGPDGNYLPRFGESYFTREHTTPWGPALNYTTTSGQAVRDFIVANARHWALEYHVDGLRLDAIHAIRDDAMPHIVEEVSTRVRQRLARDRQFLVIAEDESNYPELVRPTSERGFGLDAIYADDFHHQLHVALTGESTGYYQDYSGTTEDLASTVQRCWWFTGQPSRWRSAKEGRAVSVGHQGGEHVAPEHFIWSIQDHDQVGNRPFGQRLNQLIELDAYRAASALLLLSPYTPLLFMGQEWAASTPFLFFTDHDKALGRKVTKGRMAELARLFPGVDITAAPQPQEEGTFLRCKLRWEERGRQPHAGVLQLYTDLLTLRREHPALRHRARGSFSATARGTQGLVLRRQGPGAQEAILAVVNLKGNLKGNLRVDLREAHLLPPGGRAWHRRLDTEAPEYGGRRQASFDGAVVEMAAPGALVLEARTS